MSKGAKGNDMRRRQIAEEFCRSQLTIMDGSFLAALQRIGTERFEKLVSDVMKSLPRVVRARKRAKEGGK